MVQEPSHLHGPIQSEVDYDGIQVLNKFLVDSKDVQG